MKNSTIVAFHIGRGGRFYNPGFKSFVGDKKISDFTGDLHTEYENQLDLYKKVKDHPNLLEKYYSCCDEDDFSFFEKRLKFDMGKLMYFDCGGGNTGLTEEQYQNGVGSINIDHSYNTTYTCHLEDCDEEEISLILASNCWNVDILKEEMIELGLVEKEKKVFFHVYDKEDTYKEGECHEDFEDEEEARDFCIKENAAYGYQKFYYKSSEDQ